MLSLSLLLSLCMFILWLFSLNTMFSFILSDMIFYTITTNATAANVATAAATTIAIVDILLFAIEHIG